MMKYLTDTNVLSELAKSVPNRAVLEKFRQHRHETATASVVWHELRYGCFRLPVSRKRDALESFLDNVIKPHILILPYNLESAEWHGIERAKLSLLGRTPSFADGQSSLTFLPNPSALTWLWSPDRKHRIMMNWILYITKVLKTSTHTTSYLSNHFMKFSIQPPKKKGNYGKSSNQGQFMRLQPLHLLMTAMMRRPPLNYRKSWRRDSRFYMGRADGPGEIRRDMSGSSGLRSTGTGRTCRTFSGCSGVCLDTKNKP